MANIYRYKRHMVYYYEITANSLKEAEKALDKIWAGNYKDMKLSEYKLDEVIKIEPPASTILDKGLPVSEDQELPTSKQTPDVPKVKLAKKAVKKAAKKTSTKTAKTAKKKPAKKTTKRK